MESVVDFTFQCIDPVYLHKYQQCIHCMLDIMLFNYVRLYIVNSHCSLLSIVLLIELRTVDYCSFLYVNFEVKACRCAQLYSIHNIHRPDRLLVWCGLTCWKQIYHVHLMTEIAFCLGNGMT